jgi:hypothetical protein
MGDYNQTPVALINGRLYTITGVMDTPIDPYVTDLNAPGYPHRKIFNDDSLIKNIFYIAAHNFSPDGTKLALLNCIDDQNKRYKLYVCSTDDGSVLKSYEFATAFSSPRSVDFFENRRIAIYSERYSLSTAYMYMVDIR